MENGIYHTRNGLQQLMLHLMEEYLLLESIYQVAYGLKMKTEYS